MPIQCRGRNKWFKLHQAQAYPLAGDVAISVCSAKPYGDMPPIYLSGPKQEIVELLDKLLFEASWDGEGLYDPRNHGSSVVETLDNVTAALETMLTWATKFLPPDKYEQDMAQRNRLADQARALADRLMGRFL